MGDYKVQIEKNDEILIRKFSGLVTKDVLIDAWEKIFQQGDLLSNIKGVITDLSEAELQIDYSDLNTVAMHYNQNQKYFQGLRLAKVMDSPKVALAEVLKNKIPDIQLEIFCTVEAARKWVKG